MYSKVLFLALLIPCVIFGQSKAGYRSPLDIPLALAANFGELRTHHFHMGLDFKTNGKEGLLIRSIEDGFVSKVKVSPYGYGKVIYVSHPDGRTSVYGHCRSFKGKTDSLVNFIQSLEENTEVEIYFKPDEIKVKKGEVIALSGNTGRSSAPHLHFEIRDSKTGDALNPLLLGFKIADHIAPKVGGIKISAVDDHGFVIPGKEKGIVLNSTSNNIQASILLPSDYCSLNGGIGIAVETTDQFDGQPNKCGVYAMKMSEKGKVLFETRIDRVPFEESRHINCHMDHSEFLKGKDFHRLFKSSENTLSIYTVAENQQKVNGVLKMKPGESKNIDIVVSDVAGNLTRISLTIVIEEGKMNNSPVFTNEKFFMPDQPIDIYKGSKMASIKAEEHTLYDPLLKEYSLAEPIYLGRNSIPVELPLMISIPSDQKKNVYLEVKDEKGKRQAKQVFYLNGSYCAYVKNLGPYALKTDNTKPTIVPLGIKRGMLLWNAFDSDTEISDYDLYIDGKWVVLEYESKADLMFTVLPKGLKGQHEIEIHVVDLVGNDHEIKTTIEIK